MGVVCGHRGGDRYWTDSEGEERLRACCREWQWCRRCRRMMTASHFGPSRILKRDYECRECHRKRCQDERRDGRR